MNFSYFEGDVYMKIVYWSGTGNTEKMANLIAKGIVEKGKEAEVVAVSDANSDIFNTCLLYTSRCV